MRIEYLDLIMSAAMSLRKVRLLEVVQENDSGKIESFIMRPQIHVMVISPFGTAKSSTTKRLKRNKESAKKIFCIDNFTRASAEGSINKDGEFVPPVFLNAAGKLMIIDEWNNMKSDGQEALLSVLENQSFGRALGFRLRAPFKVKKKLYNVLAFENIISGSAYFGCVAYAMEFPMGDSKQKSKALLSRFSPIFIEPDRDMMMAISSGKFKVKINDVAQNVEEVKVPLEVSKEVHKKYFEYINENDLYPKDTDDYGFITRCYSEIIRYGVYNYMNKHVDTSKKVIVNSAEYFTDMFEFIETIMFNFLNRKTKGKKSLYIKWLKKKGKQFVEQLNLSQIAKKIGVVPSTVLRWNQELGVNCKDGRNTKQTDEKEETNEGRNRTDEKTILSGVKI